MLGAAGLPLRLLSGTALHLPTHEPGKARNGTCKVAGNTREAIVARNLRKLSILMQIGLFY